MISTMSWKMPIPTTSWFSMTGVGVSTIRDTLKNCSRIVLKVLNRFSVKVTSTVIVTAMEVMQQPSSKILEEVCSTSHVIMKVNAMGILTVIMMWMEQMRPSSKLISAEVPLTTLALPVRWEIGVVIHKAWLRIFNPGYAIRPSVFVRGVFFAVNSKIAEYSEKDRMKWRQ
jgi:hypothetical protein